MHKEGAPRPVVALAMLPGLEHRLLGGDEVARLRAVADVPRIAPADLGETSALLARTTVLLAGWGCARLDGDVLDRMPQLCLVAYAAGTVKGLVTPALWDRGIAVTSAAHANAVPVAEFTVSAIVFALNDAFRARDEIRAARGHGWARHVRRAGGTYGRRVGIVGASRVGRLVIERLRSLDVEVAVHDPYLDARGAAELRVERRGLDELAAWAQVLSLHAPLLPETRQLIGAAQMRAMPDGAWLLNTARGALVDHDALLAACRSGRINAVLDVTDPEPLPEQSPLWDLPNVVITPHIAGSTGSELRRLGQAAVTEVERFAAGEPALHPVTQADLAVTA